MRFTEKVDVLDLLINCLKEHEKELNNLTDRLSKAVATAERQTMR